MIRIWPSGFGNRCVINIAREFGGVNMGGQSLWEENVCHQSGILFLAALNDTRYFFIPEIPALKV